MGKRKGNKQATPAPKPSRKFHRIHQLRQNEYQHETQENQLNLYNLNPHVKVDRRYMLYKGVKKKWYTA